MDTVVRASSLGAWLTLHQDFQGITAQKTHNQSLPQMARVDFRITR